MERSEVPGSGQKQSGNRDGIKQEYIVLSDNDPTFEEDNQEGMYAYLQTKLQKTDLELHRIIAML